MAGLKGKRWLALSSILFVTGVLYAGARLPSHKFVQARKSVYKKPEIESNGRYKRASLKQNILIDLEQEYESLYDQIGKNTNHHATPKNILHHPRVQEWCRRPDGTLSGLEGTPIEGYKLSTVVVLATPGHLINRNYKDGNTEICNLKDFISRFADDKLSTYEEVLSIHQKMNIAKGGFKIYDSVPSSSNCKHEELSPLGVTQHIKLGEFIRKAYFDSLKTLKVLPKEIIHLANSVHGPAAYQSTLAFLHGLLSEKQFIKAGVQKIKDNLCNSRSGLTCNCKTLSQHVDFLSNSPPLQYKFTAQKNIAKAANTLEIQYFEKFRQFLEGVSNQCQTKDNVCTDKQCTDMSLNAAIQVFKMVDKTLANITKSAQFMSKSRLYSHPFLVKMVSALFEPKRDFTLYTIKDFLYLNLLVALGIPVSSLPSPASRIVIEVHDKHPTDQSLEQVVRILVNGRDFTPYLHVCSQDFEPHCNLMMLYGLKIYNYDLECNN